MRKKTKFIILIGVIVLLIIIFFLSNFILYKTGHDSLIWKIDKEDKQKSDKNIDKDKEDRGKVEENKDVQDEEEEESNSVESTDNKKEEKTSSKQKNSTSSYNSPSTSSGNTNATTNKNNNNTQNNTTPSTTTPPSSSNTNTSSTPQQPAKDPNAVDTTHPLYPSHHGTINYYTLSDCNNAGFDKSFADPSISSFSCVEVYSNAGNVLGYYLEIRY